MILKASFNSLLNNKFFIQLRKKVSTYQDLFLLLKKVKDLETTQQLFLKTNIEIIHKLQKSNKSFENSKDIKLYSSFAGEPKNNLIKLNQMTKPSQSLILI